MDNLNGHVNKFLDDYFSSENPGYAVLLKGPWGAGKTWFIENVLERLDLKGRKYIYVSLYGINSVSEIEDEFFRQLHPVLSSKGMGIASKVAKGLLKSTLKIDFHNIDNLSFSSQIPNIDIPDYLKNTEGFVLVFDDLERTSMDVVSVLGYINHFVEHQGYKVVIVANEDEIVKLDEKKIGAEIQYKFIKEKLIGKTFEITPDHNSAIAEFITKVNSEKVKKIFEENKDVVIDTFHSSQYKNLRHLKRALFDLERLISNVDNSIVSNQILIKKLLEIYLIFYFEIKSGTITAANIRQIKSEYIKFASGNIVNSDSAYINISKKYSNLNMFDLLLEESIWEEILDKGIISKLKIDESLKKSGYFKSENTPEWVRLWHAMDLEDDTFNYLLDSVSVDFYEKKFTQVGEVQHITGILIWLSENGLYSKSTAEILNDSKGYIDFLKLHGYLAASNDLAYQFVETLSWEGLGFHSRESEIFKELCEHIRKRYQEAYIESFPKKCDELLDNMKSDSGLFYRKVNLTNHKDNLYFQTPIFKYMDSKKFFNAFLMLDPLSKRTVSQAFHDRYESTQSKLELQTELPWLTQVLSLLEEQSNLSNGTMSGYQLKKYIIPNFMKAIDFLN